MATEQQIAACKAYMRVDGGEDDYLIGQLCDAAAEYLSRRHRPGRRSSS